MKIKSPFASGVATLAFASLGAGCTVYQTPPPPQRVYVQPAPAVTYVAPAPQAVISIYVEPPVRQPAPILVGWAPPPMLVESPAPPPFSNAVWVGGYWVWEGNWVWAAGHWMAPPQPNYAWVHPYYEHRDGGVIFITGHWSPPGVAFVPPAIDLRLTVVTPLPGVIPGPRPIGPQGVFVPAPPGSRLGLIVPAPIGTAPAVVTSAAPVVNVGMRIQNNNTAINNTHVTNVTNTTNVTNVTNVTIVAPASATASGKAFESAVPAQAHLAAALPAVVRTPAPVPISTQARPAFTQGRAPLAVPAVQGVHPNAAIDPNALPQRSMPPPVSAAVPPSSPVMAPASAPAAAPPWAPRPSMAADQVHPAPRAQRPSDDVAHEPAPVVSSARPAGGVQAPAKPAKTEGRTAEQQRHAKAKAEVPHSPETLQAKKKESAEEKARKDDAKAQ